MASSPPAATNRPPLVTCEEELNAAQAPEELWFRAARPADVDDGELGPSAFEPSRNDGRMISGARASKQTALGLYTFRNGIREGSVDSVWAVAAREVSISGSRLIDDSECPPPDDDPVTPGHTYLDLRYQNKPDRHDIRLVLAEAANDRGVQFPVPLRVVEPNGV